MDILTQMLAELPLGPSELFPLLATAPERYKVYKIPKRTPGKFRTIAHPARELKFIQRWLIRRVLFSLPVHPAAMAYRKETSILDNAVQHAKHRYLLKMDIQDFFPSIQPKDLIAHCAKFLPNLTKADERLLCQVLFRKNKQTDGLELSIGAPSSPLISNSIFYPLDQKIEAFCVEKNICYTRYADDLFFSTNSPHTLQVVPNLVSEVLEAASYPKLKLNQEKTLHTSKKHHRQVTGLVLSAENKISIGRDKKRTLKALVHQYTLNNLEPDSIANLRGQLSFVQSVEPSFIASLQEKYGREILFKLTGFVVKK